MLRSEIDQAVRKLLVWTEDTGLSALLKGLLENPEEKSRQPETLKCFAKYMRASHQFDAVEKTILETLGLASLNDLQLWEQLLTKDARRSTEVYRLYQSLEFARVALPRLLTLFTREADSLRAKEGEEDFNQSVLTAVVLEDRGLSSPQRLVLTLEAITGLYDACAAIEGAKVGDLSVVGCDSGSDKSLDFLGLAKVVSCVKEVILSFWDKVVYFREDKTGKQLDLISNSLPILERLSEMRASKKLEPEEAELIKRQIVDSITKFGQAGVTIPEIEDRTVFNPRQLMRAEQKLLISPDTADDQEGEKTGDQTPKKETDIPVDDPEFQKLLEKTTREFLERRRKDDDKQGDSETEEEDGSQSAPGETTDSDGDQRTADSP